METTNKVRMEGLTLAVLDVRRSVGFYEKLGFKLEWDAIPDFAMLRIGGPKGGTIGVLCWEEAEKEGALQMNVFHARSVYVELSTDNLDALHDELVAREVDIYIPPHEGPWGRAMIVIDPDGYTVKFAEGRRGAK